MKDYVNVPGPKTKTTITSKIAGVVLFLAFAFGLTVSLAVLGLWAYGDASPTEVAVGISSFLIGAVSFCVILQKEL